MANFGHLENRLRLTSSDRGEGQRTRAPPEGRPALDRGEMSETLHATSSSTGAFSAAICSGVNMRARFYAARLRLPGPRLELLTIDDAVDPRRRRHPSGDCSRPASRRPPPALGR